MNDIDKKDGIDKKAGLPVAGGEEGFSLVEVIVAMVVFAIAMIFMAKLYGVGTTYVVRSGDRRVATSQAEERLEFLSGQDFDVLETAPPSPHTAPPSTSANAAVSGYTNMSRTEWIDYVSNTNFNQVMTGGTTSNSIRIVVIIGSNQGNEIAFHDVTLTNVVTHWH